MCPNGPIDWDWLQTFWRVQSPIYEAPQSKHSGGRSAHINADGARRVGKLVVLKGKQAG